jgi:hypothetical protein
MTTDHFDSAALLRARPTEGFAALRSRAVILGAIGIVGLAAGWMVDGQTFWQSYLIGYIFWLGITLGSLALLMVQYLSGGAWGMVSRRIFEASTRNIWLMLLLFLPIAWKLPSIYAWAAADPTTVLPQATAEEATALRHAIELKAAYLNKSFFYLRAVLFFVIWGGLTFVLNRWSKEQDDSAPRRPGPTDRRFRVLSGPGLVLYMLTVTLMAVDWIMSLQPQFYSTIFGILFVGGQGLATLAFTILVLSRLSRDKPLSDVIQADHFHDLGKLMLAFVMLWAYFNISQLLIIWSANLPEEIPWYMARLKGTWMPVAVLILLGHFALPFSLLLSRDLKRHPSLLAIVAAFVLVMRVVDLTWNIGPIFREHSTIHWMDFAAVAGIGGVWLFLFVNNLAGRALVPAHDPYFTEAVAHGGH